MGHGRNESIVHLAKNVKKQKNCDKSQETHVTALDRVRGMHICNNSSYSAFINQGLFYLLGSSRVVK